MQMQAQEFKTHRSDVHGFTAQVPADAIVFNESTEYGIAFKSNYWNKIILFTPTPFPVPKLKISICCLFRFSCKN